jgi:hypothetical protein
MIDLLTEFSDHLIDRHLIFDCDYCFEQFDDVNEYVYHRADGTCTGNERLQGPRRDGIEPLQRKEIIKIHKIWSTKNYNDTDKWMGFWKVVFPNVDPPSDPCQY